MKLARVLRADDHVLVLAATRALLETIPTVKVVGEAVVVQFGWP
jgi:DNA-binding NarL/FixJ family response regulator